MKRCRVIKPQSSRRGGLAVLVVIGLAAAACSEGTSTDETAATSTTVGIECGDEAIVSCAPEGTTLDHLLPDAPVVADGEPIKIGMINTDSGPATAFPELTGGAEAAVQWLNEEVGGVDGHPIELISCDVEFSATGSQSCGQQMVEEGVVAVVGGIDIFGDGILVLDDNGIPLVGGIPVSFPAVESPTSFQFSGGSWGQNLGLVYHITEVLDAERVSIMYGDFGSVTDGAEWAQRALVGQGVAEENINMVPMPIIVEDLLTPLAAANETDPDAIIVLVADTGCAAAYQAVIDTNTTAQTYWSGACLDAALIDTVGAETLEGYIYGIENPLDDEDADLALYNEVMARYGEEVEAASAATVTFASLINLYVELMEIGADNVSSETIIEQFRASVDRPNFMGHPYTCDGQQMGGELPAICAPQQILGQMTDGELVAITDWIEVADLIQPAE